jgi:hypothetical protein
MTRSAGDVERDVVERLHARKPLRDVLEANGY